MTTNVAVLDDYHGISAAHFGKLDPSNYNIKYFPTTLPAYNLETTTQAERDEIVARLAPFDVIATMRERTPFPKELVERLPRLRLLLSCGRHNKAIDMDACRARGIPVTGSTDGIAVASTTEHIIALILGASHDIAHNDAAVKAGKWQTSLVTAVSGKVLGLVGLGRLGRAVARIMSLAFDMQIIAWSENLTQDRADEAADSQGLAIQRADGTKTFRSVSREELFSTADFISVHLLLSDRTRGLITSADLSRMKASSFFINTSRGPLVVEQDLLATLQEGKIRGAAVDVFDTEPLPADSAWRSSSWGTDGKSQVVMTPHVAYAEESVMNGFYEQQVADLQRWARGEALPRIMT